LEYGWPTRISSLRAISISHPNQTSMRNEHRGHTEGVAHDDRVQARILLACLIFVALLSWLDWPHGRSLWLIAGVAVLFVAWAALALRGAARKGSRRVRHGIWWTCGGVLLSLVFVATIDHLTGEVAGAMLLGAVLAIWRGYRLQRAL
jgi:hypothetical protein